MLYNGKEMPLTSQLSPGCKRERLHIEINYTQTGESHTGKISGLQGSGVHQSVTDGLMAHVEPRLPGACMRLSPGHPWARGRTTPRGTPITTRTCAGRAAHASPCRWC